MTIGSQFPCAAVALPVRRRPFLRPAAPLRDNNSMTEDSGSRAARLRKHADYQRVYKESRKHFSPSMSYFFRLRADSAPARVGLTAGRVLGKAVDRNRIKRRMREAVRLNLAVLPLSVDVVLHPRRSVMEMEFAKLHTEVARIFAKVASAMSGKLIPQPSLAPGAQSEPPLGGERS
jgi:ribonuclease P protein component